MISYSNHLDPPFTGGISNILITTWLEEMFICFSIQNVTRLHNLRFEALCGYGSKLAQGNKPARGKVVARKLAKL